MNVQDNSKKQSETNLQEFYNYKYWREVQRQQLSIASNLYFVISSAMIGFSVNYLIKNLNCEGFIFLFIGVGFNVLSLVSYVILTHIKLSDYRTTAGLIKKEMSHKYIQEKTAKYGKRAWFYFGKQAMFMYIGFVFCALGAGFLIFS